MYSTGDLILVRNILNNDHKTAIAMIVKSVGENYLINCNGELAALVINFAAGLLKELHDKEEWYKACYEQPVILSLL